MKRIYTTGTTNNALMFTGTEIEMSPAHGLKTLFVVGNVISAEEIYTTAIGHDITHIYFGANQSFNPKSDEEWLEWTETITKILKKGLWATLDFDAKHTTGFISTGLTEFRRFIPMISVKLPHVDAWNYNTTIKIDDVDFEATNPGVWCHRLRDLQGTDKFTSWDQYSKDTIIK